MAYTNLTDLPPPHATIPSCNSKPRNLEVSRSHSNAHRLTVRHLHGRRSKLFWCFLSYPFLVFFVAVLPFLGLGGKRGQAVDSQPLSQPVLPVCLPPRLLRHLGPYFPCLDLHFCCSLPSRWAYRNHTIQIKIHSTRSRTPMVPTHRP